MKNVVKLLTLTALVMASSNAFAAGFWNRWFGGNHKIVCFEGTVPLPQDAELHCYRHYDVKTSDGYHCFIRFQLGNDIKLVENPSQEERNQTFGKTALATYEKKTKNGIFIQALNFSEKSNVDVPVLYNAHNNTVKEIVAALGLSTDPKNLKKIMLAPTLENFNKAQNMLGKKKLPDCAPVNINEY